MAKQNTPNRYDDPFWVNLAAQTEKKLDLPEGSLRSVLLYGERSNADQVSSANAKTPFQVIPQTRKAVLDKYGVDAYLSPENAAEAAGLVLKEGLERNSGDLTEAVGEYIGGTDRNNWGKVTRAYIGRVMNGLSEIIPAAEAADMSVSIEAQLLQAYRDGRMTPEQSQEFEADVDSGLLSLPEGESLQRMVTDTSENVTVSYPTEGGQPEAVNLPQEVWNAYTSGGLTAEQQAELESDVASGLVRLPEGVQVQTPPSAQEPYQS